MLFFIISMIAFMIWLFYPLGTVHYDESNTTGITTTATSGFGPKSRGSSTTRTS